MKTIDEMIAVMTAYKEGKRIEYKLSLGNVWERSKIPRWDWVHYDYRTKPEETKPTYRPYESAWDLEEGIKEHGLWLRKKGLSLKVMIIGYIKGRVYTVNEKCETLEIMFEYYEWADGTPFGRRVEE